MSIYVNLWWLTCPEGKKKKTTKKNHHDKHDNEILFYGLVLISSPKPLSECGCVLMHASACNCITFSPRWRNSLSWETTHCRRRHPLSLSLSRPSLKRSFEAAPAQDNELDWEHRHATMSLLNDQIYFLKAWGGKKQGQTLAGSACPNTNTWKVYSVDTKFQLKQRENNQYYLNYYYCYY